MSQGQKNFLVKEDDRGRRLDIFLSAKMDRSRAQTQKLIKAGAVLVNQKNKTPHYALKTGDKITVKEAPFREKKSLAPLVEIVFTNKDFIVVDKPAGLTVHPPRENYDEETLSQILTQKFPELAAVGEKLRPGIVHRLDKDVSGLMVAARHAAAYEFLKNEFLNQRVKKIYTGLILGRLSQDFGEINFKIARKRGRMAARPESQEGKEAKTFWRVIKKYTNFTLLEIEIKTGRTHQIRVHFFALGHPLAGDPLYRAKKPGKITAPRLFLHSTELGFHNMNQEWMEFKSELPQELKNFLENLK